MMFRKAEPQEKIESQEKNKQTNGYFLNYNTQTTTTTKSTKKFCIIAVLVWLWY